MADVDSLQPKMTQRLFIRLENGQPVDHPILESNMRRAFPKMDLDNLPPNFAEFIRVHQPYPPRGKTIQHANVSYQWVDGKVQDVWDMTYEDIPDYDMSQPMIVIDLNGNEIAVN